jgi:hypothetical protein
MTNGWAGGDGGGFADRTNGWVKDDVVFAGRPTMDGLRVIHFAGRPNGWVKGDSPPPWNAIGG